MQNKQTYDNFPAWIPLLSCALSLSIYVVGAYVFSRLTILFAVLYLLFCLWIELRILQESCANCYYYGKVCGLGRGKLCALFFKQGSPEEFVEREITWKTLLPDFMVLILPLIGGTIYLIRDFSWPILALMVILAALSLAGNALMRGALACKYCKQREIGCPAEQLFSKEQAKAT
ncbi:MAG: hypothetical protein ACYS4W_13155 [Planctomycetota bacterium]|jgi:hypothetical protein